ncbi:MAG: hypothetical protein Q8P95_04135 [bacterium]|nr:hypothetical protein [bacterium]
MMSLTKGDLRKINAIFIQGFETLILPQFEEIRDAIQRINERVDQLTRDIKGLREEMHDHVFSLHQRIDETNVNIGYHFELCAPMKEHQVLVKRVNVLEAASA